MPIPPYSYEIANPFTADYLYQPKKTFVKNHRHFLSLPLEKTSDLDFKWKTSDVIGNHSKISLSSVCKF